MQPWRGVLLELARMALPTVPPQPVPAPAQAPSQAQAHAPLQVAVPLQAPPAMVPAPRQHETFLFPEGTSVRHGAIEARCRNCPGRWRAQDWRKVAQKICTGELPKRDGKRELVKQDRRIPMVWLCFVCCLRYYHSPCHVLPRPAWSTMIRYAVFTSVLFCSAWLCFALRSF